MLPGLQTKMTILDSGHGRGRTAPQMVSCLLTVLSNGVIQMGQHLPRQVLPIVDLPIIADELLLRHFTLHLSTAEREVRQFIYTGSKISMEMA